MSETSPILALPYLLAAQAQKHVTHNEALQLLDALVQLRVSGFEAETPPLSPSPGAAYALGALPTGAWAGQAGQLAIWQGEGWLFIAPQTGWRAWGLAEQELRVWQGSTWQQIPAETQNLAQVGINTSADASNRLAIAAEASLFSHAGAGHQLKLNKAAPAQTAAALFQSNWSGRAEIGLLGNDDLAFKLSGDGSSWSTGLALSASGHAGFGTTSPTAHVEIAGTGSDYLLAADGSGAAFRLGADGNGACDGAWSGGGADYAEWFEWRDGNPEAEDRRGLAVVLDGACIRPANRGEDPVGVISAAPALIGDDDLGGWKGRWQRDDFGALLLDEAGQRQERPAYDPSRPYQPRSRRPEWALVGMLGKLRLRRGQPSGGRWRRLRGISDQIEEWLIR
ncbi:DUF2793 domain-containing protein [Phaeobacter sp. 11ANDIMAR09]|uniref:DUF2793 domain-containing protein n=1 Tax=Phaeobacter sp. 11ANDIMAR09 TaxID=1225647 RepID=UPI0006C87643|nr:DUF2793 domain-containing protein [Phaeobacter sp. 11ANDIMAR09]KPD10791.1 hypothetical protein AN476_19255 [Phaeobacter sp. 11ANDIMAR09]